MKKTKLGQAVIRSLREVNKKGAPKKKAKPVKAWAVLKDGKLDPWYMTRTRESLKGWETQGRIVRVEIREI